MTQQKRRNSNSREAKTREFQISGQIVPVPDGIKLETPEHELVWEQMSSARAYDDWREIDLLVLVKIVNLEIETRQLKKEIKLEGEIVGEKENPKIKVWDAYQRQQLALIRNIQLNLSVDKRTMAQSAKKQKNAKEKAKEAMVTSLVAA